MENKTGKKTLGRRKIEIKKIQKKTSLQVTFTKRRKGIFKKASELSILCGAEIAILVQSPAEKMFAFGHPSAGALIDRLVSPPEVANPQNFRRHDDGRGKYEEAERILAMEKVKMEKMEMGGFWWDEPFEGLELHELEEFSNALDGLRENVAVKLAAHDQFRAFPPPMSELLGGDYGLASEVSALTFSDDQDQVINGLMNFLADYPL